MIKLLAVDMDGTCLNDKKIISEETLRALRAAAEAGILVVPTTGRALTCIPYQLMDEHFYRYIITSNGACTTDLETNTDLDRAEIPAADACSLLEACKKLRIGLSIHHRHQFILQGNLLRMLGKISYGKDAEHSVSVPSILKLLQKEQNDVEEIQLFYFSKAAKARTLALLQGDDRFLQAYDTFYVELYTKAASKGHALAKLTEHLGIPREEVACIGDAENDFSMFEASGMKFAMGNGIEALKQRANVVLPSNAENGVAYAIEQYLLKNNP